MKAVIAVIAVILVLLLLAAAFGLSGASMPPWGQVTINVGSWQVEMGLPLFLISLFALMLMVHFLAILWKLPKRWMHWLRQLSARKKEKTMLAGISLFAQGEWQKSHECFAEVNQPALHASLGRLFSALALINQQSFTKARRILDALSASGVPESERVAEIKQAEIELQLGHYESAFNELQRLFVLHPHNQHVAGLLVRAYSNQDHPMPAALRDRLLALTGNKKPVVVLWIVERRLWREKLHELLERGDIKALNRAWQKMRRPMQAQLAGVYAECLGQSGLHEQAERFMHQAIEAGWGGQCLDYYALMDSGNAHQRIAQLEKWLQNKPRDPALLLCLGRLYRRHGERERARQCLTLSLSLAARSDAAKELAELLNEQGAAP